MLTSLSHTLNVKPHEILFTTHTYLLDIRAFSLINADGRNAAVDLR